MGDVSSSRKELRTAYENNQFLKSRDGRTLRILSEYLEPASRLRWQRVEDTVVFFGSARATSRETADRNLAEVRERLRVAAEPSPQLQSLLTRAEQQVRLAKYYEDAIVLARLIVQWSKTLSTGLKRLLICSGGGPGIMEAANRGAKEAGGQSIGLSITLPAEQGLNAYVPDELAFVFHYFFMRKFWFVYLAKALVMFPGGFGTLDETFEVLTLVQTGKSRKKMPLILYGSEYWKEVINFDAMVQWGTISPGDVNLVHYSDDPEEALHYLRTELTRIHHL